MPRLSAHHVDVHVGARLRMRRISCDVSQETLAEKLGVSFQQIQKYEKGDNRMSAGRLHDAAVALDIDIAWFFDGRDAGKTTAHGNGARGPAGNGAVDIEAFRDGTEGLRAMRALAGIRDANTRQTLIAMAEAIAAAG